MKSLVATTLLALLLFGCVPSREQSLRGTGDAVAGARPSPVDKVNPFRATDTIGTNKIELSRRPRTLQHWNVVVYDDLLVVLGGKHDSPGLLSYDRNDVLVSGVFFPGHEIPIHLIQILVAFDQEIIDDFLHFIFCHGSLPGSRRGRIPKGTAREDS